MQATSIAHKHRHYKTLILLVVSMTVGAFFLFWLGQMTPVTPLRGNAAAAPNWNKINVRTALARDADQGFFHYRIDDSGQLYQTSAWKAGAQSPRQLGAIQVLLTVAPGDTTISPAQEKSLARLVADLRKKYRISGDQIRLDQSQALASAPDLDAPSRVGL